MTITEQMCNEVEEIRSSYVYQQVQRKISGRGGDATIEDIEAWENAAIDRWNTQYPALAKLVSS